MYVRSYDTFVDKETNEIIGTWSNLFHSFSCQLFSSSSPSSMNETTKELYGPLKLQLTRLFAKQQVNITLSMNIHTKLWDQFNDAFSKPIPVELGQRTSDEKRVVQSIRQSLQHRQPHLILRRTADNMNTFYLGDRKEFEEKANRFVTKTKGTN